MFPAKGTVGVTSDLSILVLGAVSCIIYHVAAQISPANDAFTNKIYIFAI